MNRIKHHPGPQQVERAVKVRVPGKHFPSLTPTEQKELFFDGTAMEFTERHKFAIHNKASGARHTPVPAFGLSCEFNAVDDPDNRGF